MLLVRLQSKVIFSSYKINYGAATYLILCALLGDSIWIYKVKPFAHK